MEKNEDSGFRPVARNFDELIDQFGLDVDDKEDELLPDIFKRSSREKAKAANTDGQDKSDSPDEAGQPPVEFDPNMKAFTRSLSDYMKRVDITAGVAEALRVREEAPVWRMEPSVGERGMKSETQNQAQPPQEKQPATVDEPEELPEVMTSPEKQPEIVDEPEELPEVITLSEERPEIVDEPKEVPETIDFPEDQPDYSAGNDIDLINAPVKSDTALVPRLTTFLVGMADKAVEKYHEIIPRRNLARSTPIKDRLAVLGAALAAVGIITGAIVLILSFIPQSISGRWQPRDSDSIIFEFKRGNVTTVVFDGEWKEYRHGEYKIKRQGGSNLLTITYEDGVIRHLYYKIEGKVGRFTNVDTNQENEWIKIK